MLCFLATWRLARTSASVRVGWRRVWCIDFAKEGRVVVRGGGGGGGGGGSILSGGLENGKVIISLG